jgi:hypothetical protein
MTENKDFSSMTIEELLAEQKKIKSSNMLNAGLIGFFAGCVACAIFFGSIKFLPLPILIFGVLSYLVIKSDKKQKENLKKVEELIKLK